MKVNAFQPFSLNCAGRFITAYEPVIVGILNTTPDSFYAASRTSTDHVVDDAKRLVDEGANWLDVGGCSTWPGAEIPDLETEWQRVASTLRHLSQALPEVPLSIDTYRSEIARRAVEHGAWIVNDISGGSMDPEMHSCVAELKTPYILTHFPAGKTPANMQKGNMSAPEDIVAEVMHFFTSETKKLHDLGIKDVMLDPGFGFGKSLEGNFAMLDGLSVMAELPQPLYIGVSRKSMFWKPLNTTADRVLGATTAAHAWAIERGAQILRVHDPREAQQIRDVYGFMKGLARP